MLFSMCSRLVGCSGCCKLFWVVFGGFRLSYVGMNSSVAPLWSDLFQVALNGLNLFQVIFG